MTKVGEPAKNRSVCPERFRGTDFPVPVNVSGPGYGTVIRHRRDSADEHKNQRLLDATILFTADDSRLINNLARPGIPSGQAVTHRSYSIRFYKIRKWRSRVRELMVLMSAVFWCV
jgi:hypothetical protein